MSKCHPLSAEDQLPSGFPTIDMGPQLKVVEKARTATMLCAAGGNPDPEITWFKDFLPVDPASSNGRIKQLRSGELRAEFRRLEYLGEDIFQHSPVRGWGGMRFLRQTEQCPQCHGPYFAWGRGCGGRCCPDPSTWHASMAGLKKVPLGSHLLLFPQPSLRLCFSRQEGFLGKEPVMLIHQASNGP